MFGFYFFLTFFKHRKTAFGLNLKGAERGMAVALAGNSLERDLLVQWDFAFSCMVLRILDYPNSQGLCNHQRRMPLLPCVPGRAWKGSEG